MILNTGNFGEIEIHESSVVKFEDGIPGFEDLTNFIVIENPEEDIPFQWLQSVDDRDLAFVIIDPFKFKKDYDFELPQTIIEKLELGSPEDVAVYSIVVIPEDISKMTANLRAPLIINTKNNKGKQIFLDVEKYHTKHYILEEL